MDLNHLKHFVAVAEELNFRRAAERLGIAQPPLSRSIQRLEHALRTRLLERTQQKVALTPAGAVFLEEARYMLARAQLATTLTRRVGEGDTERVSIAFAGPAWEALLAPTLRAFMARQPDIALALTECGLVPQLAGLREGRFDFGLFAQQGANLDGLETRFARRLAYLAAVPAAWPLAERPFLRLADLSACPFVLFNEKLNPTGHTQLMLACQSAGFVPKVAQETEQTLTVLRFVGLGLGIGIVAETARSMPASNVVLVPLVDLPDYLYLDLTIAWARRPLSAPLRAFLAEATAIIEESRPEIGQGTSG